MPRIIDLTLPLEDGLRGVSIEPARTLEQDGWNATTLHLYSHCGTHMDAPTHFGVSGQTIDQIPIDQCMGPAWVADVRPVGPRALIEPEHLGTVARRFKPGDSLLICTGWSEHYGQDRYRDELPRISAQLARWCVQSKVHMLGVEPPSVADVNNREELTAVHKVLLEAGIIIVEGLASLDQIHRERVTFMAFPLKVGGGDGAPVRAFAIED